MPEYAYEAVSSDGKITRGGIAARGEREAVIKLQRQGLTPLNLTPAGAGAASGKQKAGSAPASTGTYSPKPRAQRKPTKAASSKPSGLSLKTKLPSLKFSRVSARDLITFAENLAVLLEAGITLDKALSILTELSPGKHFSAVVADLRDRVREGSSLAEAMERHPGVFPSVFHGMVRAGEGGGILESVLHRLAAYMSSVQGIKEYLVSAMIYPAILTLASGGAIVVMLTFVIPKFSVIFEDMGIALPLSTQIMLGAGTFLQEYWIAILLAILACAVGLRYALASPVGRRIFDRLRLSLPMLGPLQVKIEVSRLASTLGTLLGNGVPMLTSLNMARNVVMNTIMRDYMADVYREVKEGDLLSTALSRMRFFPSLAAHMISVGEETGRMDTMLQKVADLYEKDLRAAIKKVTSVIEPLIILLMGLVIGAMVVSMLLAIFSINEVGF